MRRFLSLILMLAMLASIGAAFGEVATQESPDTDITENFGEAVSVAYMGGKLYALDYNGRIYTCEEDTFGQWKPYELPEEYTTYSREHRVNIQALVTDGETLYSIVDVSVYEDDSTTVEGLYVYELVFGEDNKVAFENELSLDAYEMIESYDDYEYIQNVKSAFIQDGMLIVATYGRGNGLDIIVFDMNDGSYIKPFTEYVEEVAPYKDDMVLVTTCDYTKDEALVQLATIDIYTEELNVLAVIPTKNYNVPTGLFYYEKNDCVYYANNGELNRMSLADVKNPISVAGMRISRIDRTPFITENGFYFACDYSDMALINIDPSARPTRQLNVLRSYEQAFEKTVKEFTNTHSNVELVIRDYQQDIVQSMMSRSSDIDVFVLSISQNDFYPLLERGYMAELTDSQIVSDFVNAMYPKLAKIAKHDGEVVALPFNLNNDIMGFDTVVFEKLGFTEEDVPETWSEYFDFLAEAARRCEGQEGISVFEPYYTLRDMRSELFYHIFNDYMLYMLTDPNAVKAFDTPLLRSLIEKYESFDYSVFGLPESYEDLDSRVYELSHNSTLIANYTQVSPYHQTSSYSMQPMPLALSDDMEPMIGTYLETIFVNPFSANRDLALEFVELMVKNLGNEYRVQVCPDENEPVLNTYYDEQVKGITEVLDDYKKRAEEAPADEQEYYKTLIESQQEYLDDFSANMKWTISEESIATYRQYAKYFVPQRYLNVEGEDGGYYQYIYQYTEGAIDKDTMLSSIDKTVRMMLLENS